MSKALLGFALVVACAVTGCSATPGSDGSATQSAAAQAFVAGDGSIVTLAPQERQPAPLLAGSTLDNERFVLTDHVGKVVVLNVWASWCAPCRSEAPALVEVAAANPNVQFVGLVTRDSPTAANAFVARNGLDYPHVIDTDGQLQLLFRDTLPPQAIPSTLIIDKQGRVAARVLGEVTAAKLRAIVEPLQVEPADAEASP